MEDLRSAVHDAFSNHGIGGLSKMYDWIRTIGNNEPSRKETWRKAIGVETTGNHWLRKLIKTIIDEDQMFSTQHGGNRRCDYDPERTKQVEIATRESARKAEVDLEVLRISEEYKTEQFKLIEQQKTARLGLELDRQRERLRQPWWTNNVLERWQGLVCLTQAVWQGRPSGCGDAAETVAEWVAAQAPEYAQRCSVPESCAPLVYVLDVDLQPAILNLKGMLWSPLPQRLTDGSWDLVSAVIDPLHLDWDGRRLAIETLEGAFVQPLRRTWAILWSNNARPIARKRHRGESFIGTWIDVEVDPIIGELQEWLRRLPERVPPPRFPSLREDPRPSPSIPLLLAEVELNLFDHMRRWRLEAVHEKYLDHSRPTIRVAVPEAERLRQWQRLSDAADEMEYSIIANCFGWSRFDFRSVHALVTVQKRQTAAGEGEWCIERLGGGRHRHMWLWRLCLREMRIAAAIMAHLREQSHIDLRWLALDIQRAAVN